MSSCSQDSTISYLETPFFYSTALHLISIIAIPTHIFGAYCILFKTPARMSSVKWSLLHLHFWSAFLDLGFSFLTIPYVILPVFGSSCLGVLESLGMSNPAQLYLLAFAIAMMGVAVIGVFENRWFCLSNYQWWRYFRFPLFLGNFVCAIGYFYPSYVNFDDDLDLVEGKEFVSCLPEEAKLANIRVSSQPPTLLLILGIGETGLLALQICIFYLLIKLYFRNFHSQLSEKTVEMQKRLIKTLILQMTLPAAIVFIPLSYCGFSVFSGYHNQALNNLSFIVISCHGFFSTIFMIVMHPPYREEVMRLFESFKSLLPCF